MDPAQLDALKAEVSTAVDTAAGIATIIVPQYAGFIILGQALAKAAPDLYADAMNLIQKDAPTQADTDDFAMKIHALANPETA
jgi:hypothetical protein